MKFKESLKFIEIEIFSYCNRKCWFCPNSFVDRISHNHLMPEEKYLEILQQLKDINYSGEVAPTHPHPHKVRVVLSCSRRYRSRRASAFVAAATKVALLAPRRRCCSRAALREATSSAGTARTAWFASCSPAQVGRSVIATVAVVGRSPRLCHTEMHVT